MAFAENKGNFTKFSKAFGKNLESSFHEGAQNSRKLAELPLPSHTLIKHYESTKG
jgi:hypothetical protein